VAGAVTKRDAPLPGAERLDERPHRRRAEHAAGDAAEHDQPVEPARRVRGDAVVQEREEGGHHQRAEEVAEEIEGPDRGATRRIDDRGVRETAHQEERAEDVRELLPAIAPREPREDRDRDRGHDHVQYLREQLGLRRRHGP
jgi:hypothetical protein